MKKLIFFLIQVLCCFNFVKAQLIAENKPGAFALVSPNHSTTIIYDDKDDALIHKSSTLFQKDLEMIGANKPELSTTLPSGGTIIIIGTVNKSK
ncbi:MAG: hypothetical protein ACXWCZ_02695, partial [Flavisolibacter sp.]